MRIYVAHCKVIAPLRPSWLQQSPQLAYSQHLRFVRITAGFPAQRMEYVFPIASMNVASSTDSNGESSRSAERGSRSTVCLRVCRGAICVPAQRMERLSCYSINTSVAGAIDKKKKVARRNEFGLVALSQRLKGREAVVAVPSAWRRRGGAAAFRSLRTRASHSLCGGRHGPRGGWPWPNPGKWAGIPKVEGPKGSLRRKAKGRGTQRVASSQSKGPGTKSRLVAKRGGPTTVRGRLVLTLCFMSTSCAR